MIFCTRIIIAYSVHDGYKRQDEDSFGGDGGGGALPHNNPARHQDPVVRKSLVSLLASWCRHSTMSTTACYLWITFMSVREEMVAFSTSPSHIFSCKNVTLPSSLT